MIDDFLYNNPEYYEKVFPHRGKSAFCIEVFKTYLSEPPKSVLDIGCGTGRDLADLAKVYHDCVGFDVAHSMVDYAKKVNPELKISVGDMRTYRLNRTFDVICALGGCINFALTNEDLEATIETYRSHAHKGSLLLLQPLNPNDFLGDFKVPRTFSFPIKNSKATGIANYKLLKMQQVVERKRVWRIEGQEGEFSDSMSYRIIFVAELSYFLKQHGFEVLDILESAGSAVYATPSMYVVARYEGS